MSETKERGDYGEKIAARYLLAHGYLIIGKNIKLSYQEIDIIAKKDGVLVFAEVRTRIGVADGSAEYSLRKKKMASLKLGIRRYCRVCRIYTQRIRIDLIAIYIDLARKKAKIFHYRNIS